MRTTRSRFEWGPWLPLEHTTAESQVATSQLDLVNSQAALDQQEISLKNALSRTGPSDPELANVTIIPVDHIVVPEKDNLPPLRDLVATALSSRPDLEAAKANITTLELSALGTKNSILPSLEVFGSVYNSGLAGVPRTVNFGNFVETPNPFIVGSISTALGQIFRRNYPSEKIGVFLGLNPLNRQAIADQVIDQATIRQTQLSNNKTLNQVVVDVSNQVVALQQARSRYEAAVHNRVLEQGLLGRKTEEVFAGCVHSLQRSFATTRFDYRAIERSGCPGGLQHGPNSPRSGGWKHPFEIQCERIGSS